MPDKVEVPVMRAAPWGVPDWLSPARLLATTNPQWSLVTVAAGDVTQILKPSARRVGLIVIANPSDATATQLTPYPNNPSFGFALVQGQNPFVATLSDWLSAINGGWYALNVGGTTLQVCDIVRL